MTFIFYAAGLFLAVLGAVELIRWLSFRLFRGPASRGQLALIVLPQGPEDCEMLLRAAAQRVEWMALRPRCRLIFLDGGDPQAREIAERLKETHPELELAAPEELAEKLAGGR